MIAHQRSLILAVLLLLPFEADSQAEARRERDYYPAAKTGSSYMHNYYLPPAGSSTPWWPSWSPDGKSLAFAMHGSIWKIRVDESSAEEWVHAPQYLSSPEWSPDGRWLAYTADDDGRSINLMLMNITTGETTALTTGTQVNIDPAWSPDSKRLAYVSTAPTDHFNIYVQDLDEGHPGKVLAVTTDHSFGHDRLYFGEYDLHISPTWSPDGRELIFVSNRGIPLGSGSLWRAPAAADVMNSGRAKMILREETLYRSRPHWSPDGKRIVYSSYAGGQYNNLFILPAESGDAYKMTFGEYDSFHPRWSPDGEWIAYVSNEFGLPQLKLLKSWGGQQKLIKILSLRWKRTMGSVEVSVTDAATGKEMAARIYAKASDGKSYTPADSYEQISSLGQHLFQTRGHFRSEVPAGPYTIETVRGFEYLPTKRSIEIRPGAVQHITIALQRLVNLKARGWYSGSNHVHMNYGGNLHNTPETLYWMASAEDLDVICHQIANKDNRILDYQYFAPGRMENPVSTSERIMHSGQEYRPQFLGHAFVFNLKDNLISPFLTGYEGTGVESLYPSNTDIFRFARAQGAVVGYVHPFSAEGDPLHNLFAPVTNPANLWTARGGAKGFPVDVALGTASYLELWAVSSEGALIAWHHALNNGFKVPVTGGEDSISNTHNTQLVGAMRGYFLLGTATLSWANYLAALLKGRGFVTNGPLLAFAVNQALPGDEIYLPASGGTVRLHGELNSIVPLDRLEVIRNGEVIEKIPLTGERRHAAFDRTVKVAGSGWYTLQAIAAGMEYPIENGRPMATTNAIYVYVGDRPIRNKASAEYFITWIDKLTDLASRHPGWRSEKEKRHVLDQFQEARQIYVQHANEAQ
jgi:Tol biopolymer transport system component